MAEAIAKFALLVVDALTPRSVRLILVAAVVGLGYKAWLQDQAIADQGKTMAAAQVEMVKVNVKLEAMVKSTEEGNAELRAIRQWLMARPTR